MLSKSLTEVLSETLEWVIEFAEADFGNIQLVDPEGHLRIFVHRGFPDWWVEYWDTVSAGQGVCGTSVVLGEHVIVEDVEQSPIFAGSPALDIQLKAGIRAVQSTPVITPSGQVVAMISTHYRKPHRPSEKIQKKLDLVAAFLAAFIERTQHAVNLPLADHTYRSIVEDQTEVISRVLADGTFTFVNEAFCRLYGSTPDQLIGRRWHPVAHPDDVAMIEARLAELSPDKPSVSFEARNYLANGELRWMQWVSRGIFDAEGKLAEIQSVGHDITPLKQIEADLRASEERLKRVSDNADVGLARFDRNFTFQSANPAYARIVGMSEADIVGQPLAAIVGEPTFTEIRPYIERALNGERVSFETKIAYPDERVRYVHVSNSPDVDETGKIMGWVACVSDITPLMEAENALREREERLHLALSGTGLAFWDWDVAKDEVFCDERLTEILGWSPEELRKQGFWLQIIDPRDRARVEHAFNATLQGEAPLFDLEHRFRHKDGHWVSVQARAKVNQRDEHGAPLRMVETLLDVSQRKRLNEEGIELLKQIEALIRDTSLKSPAKKVESKALDSLTKRERQILIMIAQGMTSAQIGDQLHLATNTIISHRKNLMSKLDLHTTAEVTRFAMVHGLLKHGQ